MPNKGLTSSANLALVVDLYDRGFPITEIAKEMGCSRIHVYRLLAKKNVELRPHRIRPGFAYSGSTKQDVIDDLQFLMESGCGKLEIIDRMEISERTYNRYMQHIRETSDAS